MLAMSMPYIKSPMEVRLMKLEKGLTPTDIGGSFTFERQGVLAGFIFPDE